jgi:hypothetical protein
LGHSRPVIGLLLPGDSSTVQYTFTHKQYAERHKTDNTQNNTKILEECVPCPIFADFTLAFALQLRKKHGKTSVRVAKISVILM